MKTFSSINFFRILFLLLSISQLLMITDVDAWDWGSRLRDKVQRKFEKSKEKQQIKKESKQFWKQYKRGSG